MLPESGCACWLKRGMVKSPDRKGDDHGCAAARDVGPGRPRRAGPPLPDHPRRHHPDPLPDGPAARRGPPGRRGRAADPLQPRHRPPRPQALPGRRARRRAAPAPPRPATPLPARVAGRAGPGGGPGPPRGRGRQCPVDVPAAGRLPCRGHRPPGGDRDGPRRAAPGRVGVQAAPLGAVPQGPGPAGVGKKRLRVEALLGAAASPLPPPAGDLVPDATLAEDLFPDDLPRLLGLLARADLYLQDEVEVALHPTLTRVWSRAGRAGQRRVQAPGKNFKRCGFGLVDWRDGYLDWALADGRRAVPFCEQLRRAVDRSRSRGRIAMVILDNLGIHTPKGSRLLRALLAELGEDLVLVYTPTYDPDANRIEWLWRALRRTVTHTHQRQRLQDLVADADRWARTIPAAQVLSQIGSPFAPDQQPALREVLNHAA